MYNTISSCKLNSFSPQMYLLMHDNSTHIVSLVCAQPYIPMSNHTLNDSVREGCLAVSAHHVLQCLSHSDLNCGSFTECDSQ